MMPCISSHALSATVGRQKEREYMMPCISCHLFTLTSAAFESPRCQGDEDILASPCKSPHNTGETRRVESLVFAVFFYIVSVWECPQAARKPAHRAKVTGFQERVFALCQLDLMTLYASPSPASIFNDADIA